MEFHCYRQEPLADMTCGSSKRPVGRHNGTKDSRAAKCFYAFSLYANICPSVPSLQPSNQNEPNFGEWSLMTLDPPKFYLEIPFPRLVMSLVLYPQVHKLDFCLRLPILLSANLLLIGENVFI